MSHYKLYVIDEEDRAASWSHTNGKARFDTVSKLP